MIYTPLSPLKNTTTSERVLKALLKISNLVGSVMLLDDILDRIVNITSELMDVPICSIYLFDDNGDLVLRSNVGFEKDLKGKARFQRGQGIPGWVAEHGEILALDDATFDMRYAPLPSILEKECRAYLCAPLRIQEEIVGVMTMRKTYIYHFSHDEILFFETACKQIAIVLEKSKMYQEKSSAERLAAVAVSLTGVAHYIKNVLFTMQGGEYLVEQGLLRNDVNRAREGWEVLSRANRKIRGLVENILNYCRKSEFKLHPVNLNDMIDELLRTLEDMARDHNVSLRCELDPEIQDVWINPESFYDALLNLVSNGIEAVPEDQAGTVTVRTERMHNRNQVRIDVRDTGSGIPEDIRDKIFNLFFSTKGQKGTGIGLAATRKIIEDHNGIIELGPHKEGEGAHFSIFLPINKPVEAPEEIERPIQTPEQINT